MGFSPSRREVEAYQRGILMQRWPNGAHPAYASQHAPWFAVAFVRGPDGDPSPDLSGTALPRGLRGRAPSSPWVLQALDRLHPEVLCSGGLLLLPSSLLRPQLPDSAPLSDFPFSGYTASLAMRVHIGWPEPFPLSSLFLSNVQCSKTSGSPTAALSQFFAAGNNLRLTGTRFGAPVNHPLLWVGAISRLNHTARWIARPLDRLDLGLPPAAGTFTPELSLDESPPSNVRYDYGAAPG